jgi:hypothetical protein
MIENEGAHEPVPVPRVVLCPYCGEVSKDPARCESCRGHFDPLSRQATQNSMGPWFIRDSANPHRPGCSFEVLRGLCAKKKIALTTILRGPTTNQFWSPARRAPGVANLLGVCHNCGIGAGPDDVVCLGCGAAFQYHADRQHLGLTEVRLLPGHAAPEVIAAATAAPRESKPTVTRPVARPAPIAATPTRAAEEFVQEDASSGGGVPKWVWAIAALAVVGAGVAAAWIMDQLPGFPSPVRNDQAAGMEAGSDADGPRRDAAPIQDSSESGEAEAVAPGADPKTEPQQGPSANREAETAESEARAEALAAAREALMARSEESLKQAGELGDDVGPEAAAIREAAERLKLQAPLQRLP